MTPDQRAFFILELPESATPGEIERQGRKLLGLLELGGKKHAQYTCVLGTFPRDASLVREAMALLRDPPSRELEAFLGSLVREPAEVNLAKHERGPGAPLAAAFRIGGYEGL